MNVTCPAVVSSTPRNSAARQPSSANVRLLYSPFHGSSPPTAPGGCSSARSINSSFIQLSHRHRRPISSKRVLVVRARSSTFDSDGDRGIVQKKFAMERDDSASKIGVSWVSDGRVSRAPRKQLDKAPWAESRDFWSSANHHASSGSSSGDFSSPNNHQRALSRASSQSQTLPTNSDLKRKQQTRVLNPSDASRLQNRLPAFRQAAEPDAFGASFSPVHGADAFTSFNGQSPSSSGALTQKSSSLEDDSSRSESVFTSKLEEILNKFRTREKHSSSRDDTNEEGMRNGAAPSALQSDKIRNEEFQATRSKVNRLQANGDWRTSRKDAQNPRNKGSIYESSAKDDDFNEEENVFSTSSAEHDQRGSRRGRRLGTEKGHAGGLYKTEGAPSNSSAPLPGEEQGVRSAASDRQSPIRKGSSNFAGTRATKSSQSSVSGNNRRSPNSNGHWSTGVEKSVERGNHSKPFSMSQKDHSSDAKNSLVSEFDWTDSDKEDNVDMNSSITSDDGASSSHSKEADQPSSGKIATWHRHSSPNLSFEFQYSYSETPKARIIRYREEPYSPFGPDTMGRPWTGRAPLNKSKKKRPEFDSFKPPPAGKKGIKFVQSPGPYPEGQGPTPARSREEILGEPLTGKEIAELVDKCRGERRQLNLGRDGLTHNMLDLIHSHWKRRRVVKIKSMGVPTVDMDNVCFHLEDKTGGKIIYRTGGVVFLFRGRNYNYKDRPEIPLMLWKPISPVYPRLIKRAPEGLTVEEADKLRLLGQKVQPLCTLGKNGVYLTLVKDVRAAFRVDDLVRIDCHGLNPSDYKKIGAKLRDLVPCVLLSFDDEQILMWKGKTAVSANVDADSANKMEATNGSEVEAADSSAFGGVGPANLSAIKVLADDAEDESHSAIEKFEQQALVIDTTGVSTERSECSTEANSASQTILAVEDDILSDKAALMPEHTKSNDRTFDIMPGHERASNLASDSQFSESRSFTESNSMTEDQEDERIVPKTTLKLDEYSKKQSSQVFGAGKEGLNDVRVVRVDALWDQAIASGIAIQLDDIDTDSDVIVKKARELDAVGEYTRKLQSKLRLKKQTTPRPDDDLRIHFANLDKAKLKRKAAKGAFRLPPVDVPDSGGLPLDELARLLSVK